MTWRRVWSIGGAVILGALMVLFFMPPRAIDFRTEEVGGWEGELDVPASLVIPEAAPPKNPSRATNGSSDIGPQAPLSAPPEVVKAIYATSWSAGSERKMNELIALIERTELNGIVIDIKDYSGFVAYRTGIHEIEATGAEKDIRIAKPNALIERLHAKGIYVVARISVFQDSVLARAHPEWALRDRTTGEPWKDRKGLMWLDPAEQRVWDYIGTLAGDAFGRGFDEVNFDYIRFASDGDLVKIAYPAWDGQIPKASVIRNFFKYLRERLPGGKISADLFGLATVSDGDLGIGQIIEDAYEYFDYVSPMVYPSHYARGSLGFQNPAAHPYEIVRYSLEKAFARLMAVTNNNAKLRPWLQDFDLGASYDAAMVRSEIRAVEEALGGDDGRGENAPADFRGWLLWSPSNHYTEGALLTFPES